MLYFRNNTAIRTVSTVQITAGWPLGASSLPLDVCTTRRRTAAPLSRLCQTAHKRCTDRWMLDPAPASYGRRPTRTVASRQQLRCALVRAIARCTPLKHK